MFDEKKIDTYRSISAPTSLRKRVLSSIDAQPTRQNFTILLRRTFCFATCFVLVIVLSVFSTENFHDTSVWVADNIISPKTSIEIYPEYEITTLRIQQTEQDITPSVAFSIMLNLPAKTQISVSSGEMQLTTNDAVSFGTTFTTKDDIVIVWHVNPNDSDNAFVMILKSLFKSEQFVLNYDETTDIWTFSRE